MEKGLTLKRNDEIEITIDAVGAQGQGIGRYEGMTVFVSHTLVGERVKAHVIKVTSSYAIAKPMEIIHPSENRVQPNCMAYPRCGGCTVLHMKYDEQLCYKRQIVVDAIERIGGFWGIAVNKTIGMENPYRYRNKASFPFVSDGKQICAGLYAPRSHRLIAIDDCIIQDMAAIEAMRAVRSWANANAIEAYDEATHKGLIRGIVVRAVSGGVMVIVVSTAPITQTESLVSILNNELPELKSIVNNINPDNTNVIMGAENRLVWGSLTVTETICGIPFSLSAESFLQVNPKQTETLYMQAIEALSITTEDKVLDLYCGIGTISLLAAKRSHSVTGIESVERAVFDARANAQKNGITNASFICGTAESIMPRLIADGNKYSALILDPPRKGADSNALKAIINSQISRLAYISCDPATLARDCKILANGGYSIASVQPVDMFPHTAHVETVVLMERA